MLFNSIEFTIFLPIVFALYWLLRSELKFQNLLLVLASFVFYGWWDWRFLFLIVFSAVLDFILGQQMHKTEQKGRRRLLLSISLIVNLGFLCVFKYYNFFMESFSQAFSLFGQNIEVGRLRIILPVGISFYTFQTLSYTIDVFRKKMKPTNNIVAFFAFVSFFPQLVAGPIERATKLLPQFYKKRTFDHFQAVDGMRQILWGLFKKVVIADNCATFANQMFADPANFNGSTLFLGAIFFTFQIYGDFSGYSDIAIGTARLFGFKLMRNFAYPYFSRDIAEFWRRWHISLSTWFRDYLYIPLGGSRGGTSMKIRNTFIIFIVSGFWHGANWTFIVWGALNAIYFLPLMLSKRNRNNMETVAEGRFFPSLQELLSIGLTFILTILAWIFFRADSVVHAFQYLAGIFQFDFFQLPEFNGKIRASITLAFIFFMLFMEWIARADQHALEKTPSKLHPALRISFYYLIVFFMLWYSGNRQEFIYFQF